MKMGRRSFRRRKRKTYDQLQMLVKEFKSNPDWTKEIMLQVSLKTGLSEAQVYKWGWDQKRKMQDPDHDVESELKMLKREEEEELNRLKMAGSYKKARKYSTDYEASDNKENKIVIKNKRAGTNYTIKSEKKDNKENEDTNRSKNRLETRGVKRKLKVFAVESKQNDLLDNN